MENNIKSKFETEWRRSIDIYRKSWSCAKSMVRSHLTVKITHWTFRLFHAIRNVQMLYRRPQICPAANAPIRLWHFSYRCGHVLITHSTSSMNMMCLRWEFQRFNCELFSTNDSDMMWPHFEYSRIKWIVCSWRDYCWAKLKRSHCSTHSSHHKTHRKSSNRKTWPFYGSYNWSGWNRPLCALCTHLTSLHFIFLIAIPFQTGESGPLRGGKLLNNCNTYTQTITPFNDYIGKNHWIQYFESQEIDVKKIVTPYFDTIN